MSAPALAPAKSGQFVAEIGRFAPTTADRFAFDTYCSVQMLLFLEPSASGAVSWDVLSPNVTFDNALLTKLVPIQAEVRTPAASGVLLLDTNLIFSSSATPNWNTPLRPLLLTFEQTALPARPLVAPIAPKPICLTPPVVDLATPYAILLDEHHATSPWRSWKKLARLLGTSHTQLRRIAEGKVAVPSTDVAHRIDELHRFARRLERLSRGNGTVTTRLLTTQRARDQRSANDLLGIHDYKNAFRAVMDAASPRPHTAGVETVPRRWYDEPSRDLYDDGNEHDG
ncbi:MAG: hypothetical protein ACLPYS_19080 [Vulcanimicrobiaceae bacterium]